jgi:hypothetical protein
LPPEPRAGAVVAEARSLNRLNPEISVTGNLLGVVADGREEFQIQELELDLQSALDPFSRMRLTLAVTPEEIEIEEVFLVYPALERGLGLTAGRFRQQFGVLNRQHLHALPQSDYPLALRTFFGEDGLAQTGVSLRWLLPRPWASANEITLEITNGENDFFGGEFFERLSLLGHVKNYWDLGAATYFEWGLSGIVGDTEAQGTARVWGSDFTLHWQPPGLAKYRELTWRTELLLSQRDGPDGARYEAWGGYAYLQALLRRNLHLGVRVDLVENPVNPAERTRALVPYLTWWQSEFVRLRGELQRLRNDLTADTENSFVLQVTWAAGPHKHESY